MTSRHTYKYIKQRKKEKLKSKISSDLYYTMEVVQGRHAAA